MLALELIIIQDRLRLFCNDAVHNQEMNGRAANIFIKQKNIQLNLVMSHSVNLKYRLSRNFSEVPF